MTEEQIEDIIQKYLSNLKKKMMSLDIKNKKKYIDKYSLSWSVVES